MDRRDFLKIFLGTPIALNPALLQTHMDTMPEEPSWQPIAYDGEIGMRTIEKAMGGFQLGKLTVLIGHPCSGKTAFLSTRAWFIARHKGIPVMFMKHQPASSLPDGVTLEEKVAHHGLKGITYMDIPAYRHTQQYVENMSQLNAAPLTFNEQQSLGEMTVEESWGLNRFLFVDNMVDIYHDERRNEKSLKSLKMQLDILKSVAEGCNQGTIVSVTLHNWDFCAEDHIEPPEHVIDEYMGLFDSADVVMSLHRPSIYSDDSYKGGSQIHSLYSTLKVHKGALVNKKNIYLYYDWKRWNHIDRRDYLSVPYKSTGMNRRRIFNKWLTEYS